LSTELNSQTVADDSSRSGDFLCFCLEISKERFQSFIAQNPTLSLDEIRVKSGVGSKCTACLLDSEVAYAEAVQNIVLRPGRGDDPGRSWLRLPKKADIYAALDRLAPLVQRRPIEWGTASVLGGKDVSTVLRIANDIRTELGEPPSPISIDIRLRDHEGRVHVRETVDVEPGAAVARELSQALPAVDGSPITWGYCELRRRVRRLGSGGISRPHVQIKTRRGAAHVHAIGGGIGRTRQVLMRYANGDRQFLHAMNAQETGSKLTIDVSALDGSRLLEIDRVVPPYCAMAIEMPAGPAATGRPQVQFVDVQSEPPMRFDLVIADGDLGHFVVEHLSR